MKAASTTRSQVITADAGNRVVIDTDMGMVTNATIVAIATMTVMAATIVTTMTTTTAMMTKALTVAKFA